MMHVSLDKEEVALRRRALFRLLRRFDFDAPQFHGESITAPVSENLMAADYQPALRSERRLSRAPAANTSGSVSRVEGPSAWLRKGTG